jgi:hypothetical protein
MPVLVQGWRDNSKKFEGMSSRCITPWNDFSNQTTLVIEITCLCQCVHLEINNPPDLQIGSIYSIKLSRKKMTGSMNAI